jgi:Flp pilus assembly protein TadG
MITQTESKRSLKKLLRDEAGATAVILTIYLPVILGFYTLATDMAYVLQMRNLLQVTADAAAISAAAQLVIDPNNSCQVAKDYAHKNMANAAPNGDVLKNCTDVVLGSWPPAQPCTAGTACALPACGSSGCNAVKVTTRMTAANGNPLSLFFAQMIGRSSFDITATSVAAYGGTTAQALNIVVAQDISQSFTNSNSCPDTGLGTNCIAYAKAAETALLSCVNKAGSGSKFGVNLLTGTSTTGAAFQDATTTTGNQTLSTKINAIGGCGTNGMPACSGTNFAPALTSSTNLICPSGNCTATSTGPKNAIVFITDGEPNCSGMSGGAAACENAAITAVNTAAAEGIDVYVIFYGPANSSDAAWLQTLPRGKGTYLNAPTSDQIKSGAQQICLQNQPPRLVW